MDLITFFSAGFGLVIFCFLLLSSILWIFVPFAIFGIKKLLSEQVKLLRMIAGVKEETHIPYHDQETCNCFRCVENRAANDHEQDCDCASCVQNRILDKPENFNPDYKPTTPAEFNAPAESKLVKGFGK